MAGTRVYLPRFKEFLRKVEAQCKRQGIKIVANSGAKCKNIERAFYKSFYVYAVNHGDNAFKQMTDVLRCSLVFDEFDDLYKCFSVIKEVASDDEKSEGILRVKDRFNPDTMPFGYRDMLINIYCPGSKLVCEIQLHHALFYRFKTISHEMYKKARLFEDVETDENLAYKFADKEIRPRIGDRTYQLQADDVKDDADDGKDPWDGKTFKIKGIDGGYLGACNEIDKDLRDHIFGRSYYVYSHNDANYGTIWKATKRGNGYVLEIVQGLSHLQRKKNVVHYQLAVHAYHKQDIREDDGNGRSVWCMVTDIANYATVFSITTVAQCSNQNLVTLTVLEPAGIQKYLPLKIVPVGYNVAVCSEDKDRRDENSVFVAAHSEAEPSVFELIYPSYT